MAKTQTGQQKTTVRKGTGPVTVKSKKIGSRSRDRDNISNAEIGFGSPKLTLRDGKQIIPSVEKRALFLGYLGGSNHSRSVGEGSLGGATVQVVQHPGSPRQRNTTNPQYAPVIATPAEKAVLPISESPMHIAETIRQFNIEGHPAWKSLLEMIPGATKFAIECAPTSVDLREDGEFSTRARLLVEVPKKLSSGRQSFGSVTVPAFVTGTLKGNGELKIKEFRLGLDQPPGTERDAGATTSNETRAVKSGLDTLSARENEVLSCLLAGSPTKMIARKLEVSEATVKVMVKAILRRINAKNRTQAVLWAREHLPE
ncbi:response regulator transcription factor [Microvirga sp. Mcv34]|uniref:response regulator transcription factor n=1 Tax=Microvirga sp. Mcv34 TaxID=2926016 RepID=UPI0021C8350D|nr:LuxR C-terminal-related transcriptional regulator [Microvirga sp. Mcv34]